MHRLKIPIEVLNWNHLKFKTTHNHLSVVLLLLFFWHALDQFKAQLISFIAELMRLLILKKLDYVSSSVSITQPGHMAPDPRVNLLI